jgi:predicted secreted hydrolase
MRKIPLAFPKDHGSHDAIIEWWYYNGHLKDAKGRRYAFMDCLFKVNAREAKIPFTSRALFPKKHPHLFFAHSVVTDIAKKRNEKDIHPLSLLSRDSFSRPLLYLNYANPLSLGYANHEIAQTGARTFRVKTETLDLALEAKKPPMLEQGNGLVRVADRRYLYYSMTDVAAKGMIRVDGKWINVEGKAWMDHQWADETYSKDHWNWFSLQLDNGCDLMCVEYLGEHGVTRLFDVIGAGGKASHGHDVNITPSKKVWKSRKTGNRYPLAWTIEVPSCKAKFEVSAPVSDQEMIFFEIDYWEGPLDVSGTMDGKPVRGVGFMELVHSGKRSNYFALTGKEIQKKVAKALKETWRG